MKKPIILPFCILQLSTVVKSQEPDFKKRISIEAGLGYNTLSWETTSSNENLEFNRNQFVVFPSVKIKYSIPLYNIKTNSFFGIAPFVGYNMFGGKSGKEPNGYEDVIHLQALEVGILPTFFINDKFRFYGGLKGQYIFSAKQKSYGSILDPAGTGRTWKSSDVNGLFKDFSLSTGVGFNYILKRFSIGIET